MQRYRLELNDQGYLIVPLEISARHFPEDVCMVDIRGRELWLFPVHSQNAGGILLKQRNSRGERSLLLLELLPRDWQPGIHEAFWDETNAVLRLWLKNAE